MEEKRHHYWAELNRYLTFGLHELLYIPTCCVQCIAAGQKRRKELRKTGQRLVKLEVHRVENQYKTFEPGEVIVQSKQNHSCKACGEDIIARAHSSQALKYAQGSNISFQNWLINDFDRMDPYQALPHASGYEQNINGLKDEHLQRVEQYWIDHQLRNPSCTNEQKSFALASVADWERTKLAAEEAGHRMAENG